MKGKGNYDPSARSLDDSIVIQNEVARGRQHLLWLGPSYALVSRERHQRFAIEPLGLLYTVKTRNLSAG